METNGYKILKIINGEEGNHSELLNSYFDSMLVSISIKDNNQIEFLNDFCNKIINIENNYFVYSRIKFNQNLFPRNDKATHINTDDEIQLLESDIDINEMNVKNFQSQCCYFFTKYFNENEDRARDDNLNLYEFIKKYLKKFLTKIEDDIIEVDEIYKKCIDKNDYSILKSKGKKNTFTHIIQNNCFALVKKGKFYYCAISGFNNDLTPSLRKTFKITKDNKEAKITKKIKYYINKLFDKKIKWCKLNSKVLRYIEHIEDYKKYDYSFDNNFAEIVLLNKPIALKEVIKKKLTALDSFTLKRDYSCCERKILTKLKKNDNFIIYVKKLPCVACRPPLENKEVFCFYENKFQKVKVERLTEYKHYNYLCGTPVDKLRWIVKKYL